jgi:hypothetical protein
MNKVLSNGTQETPHLRTQCYSIVCWRYQVRRSRGLPCVCVHCALTEVTTIPRAM